MTGGALPAMTWHGIMKYAHQGIEVKQLPGVPVPNRKETVVAESKKKQDEGPPPRPPLLTKRGAEVLVQVERMMDDANRALGGSPAAANTTDKRVEADSPAALMTELENATVGKPNRN
jgi:penicillin-binding protein 1A